MNECSLKIPVVGLLCIPGKGSSFSKSFVRFDQVGEEGKIKKKGVSFRGTCKNLSV